jgi:hypothetical protein
MYLLKALEILEIMWKIDPEKMSYRERKAARQANRHALLAIEAAARGEFSLAKALTMECGGYRLCWNADADALNAAIMGYYYIHDIISLEERNHVHLH